MVKKYSVAGKEVIGLPVVFGDPERIEFCGGIGASG